MDASFLPFAAATGALWGVSAALALGLGLAMAAATLNRRAQIRWLGHGAVTLTRGVPTSLLVVAAGIATMPVPAPRWLPNPFPGTADGMSLVAWTIVIALALGSSGHLAVILSTAYAALGRRRLEQCTALGLGRWRRLHLVAHEASAIAIAPVGARLVHHLHNTAFAALFPVADLFGWIQDRANTTFEVTRYALTGAGVYVLLSALIWAATRILEHRLVPGGARRKPVTT